MFNNKKIRAGIAWLLAIFLLVPLTGCGGEGLDIIDEIINSSTGSHGGLQIAGKNTDYKEPQRKSLYYLELDEVSKRIYDAAYTAQSKEENEFTITGIELTPDCDSYAYTLTLFINDHPEFFWLNGYVEISTTRMSNSDNGNMTVTLGAYEYWNNNDIKKAKGELEDALESVVAQAKEISDEYEKIKFVHDYIIEFNTYDFEAYELGDSVDAETDARVSSAYGALVLGDVMCAGYTRAFDLVMHELGYESFYVSGATKSGSHAWNLLKIGEDFYHIDLTWDDLDGDPAEVRYNYFCLTDEEITKTHSVDKGIAYPKANATEYNYFVRKEMLLDYYSFAAVTKLAKKYDGSGVFAFKCYDAKVMADAVEELVNNNMIFKLAEFKNVESFQYLTDDEANVLTFYIE
ncbi:MAG: hypothetical protein IJY97_03270 [Clostridia bacterium]|nr:hypothetical protein [Clostridia bacterium]